MHRKSVVFAVLATAIALSGIAATAQRNVRITIPPTLEYVSGNAVTVAWATDVPSGSRVWWGKDKNNLTHIAEGPETGVTTHRVSILNLEPNTTYYFQVESGQTRGTRAQNEAESAGVLSFRTTANGQVARNQTPRVAASDLAAGDVENGKVKITNGPVIESATGNTARIAWTTNIPGSTRVNYGTDMNNMTQLAEAPWGQGGDTHRVELKNLKPNTTYYFQVETGQAAGSDVESHVFMFKTPSQGGQLGRLDHPQQVR